MLNLTGRIFREEGMFIAHLTELGQSTWGASLEEVMADVQWLAVEHLEGLRMLGTFHDTLSRLGGSVVDNKIAISLHIVIDDSVLPTTNGAPMTFDSSASMSLAA